MSLLLDIVGKLPAIVNHVLVVLEDAVFFLIPSTPDAIKPAIIIAGLHDAAPMMPWGLLASRFSIIGVLVAGKMVWRVVLSLMP